MCHVYSPIYIHNTHSLCKVDIKSHATQRLKLGQFLITEKKNTWIIAVVSRRFEVSPACSLAHDGVPSSHFLQSVLVAHQQSGGGKRFDERETFFFFLIIFFVPHPSPPPHYPTHTCKDLENYSAALQSLPAAADSSPPPLSSHAVCELRAYERDTPPPFLCPALTAERCNLFSALCPGGGLQINKGGKFRCRFTWTQADQIWEDDSVIFSVKG